MSGNNQNTAMEIIKNDFVPSIISGSIAGVASSYIAGVNPLSNFTFLGAEMPAIIVAGVPVMVAHLLGGLTEDMILKRYQSESVGELEGELLKPTLAGGFSYLTNRFMVTENVPLETIFVAGASVWSADYIAKGLGL